MEYVVIGAGPAGLQAGYFLQHAGREYVVLEAGTTPGTFYRTFPRHRRMLSVNKPNTGLNDPEKSMRYDWNSLLSMDSEKPLFTSYSGKYLRYLLVGCGDGSVYRADRVIVATGLGAANQPRLLKESL